MEKPQKTLADYLVVAISPILIMVLVGSLAFFLIQLLYRGDMIQGIRWVMFWFVVAIVLVSRVSIEQGKGHARIYGVLLAIATWFFLAHSHTMPLLAVMLLAVTWWCAHRLTVDCTLINDDEDASGEGVLEGFLHNLEENLLPSQPPRIGPIATAKLAQRPRRRPPRRPGRSVIYFSVAALPLFGIGQLMLPADDPEARRIGFAFLAAYLGAALSLLMTTSFLGMRRYLRQRSVEMPTNVAFSWVRFGVVLAGSVLMLALLLPRPGAQRTWKDLLPHFEHKKQKANDYAFPWNPPGEGDGSPTTRPNDQTQSAVNTRRAPPGQGPSTPQETPHRQSNPNSHSTQSSPTAGGGASGDRGPDGQSSDSSQRDEHPDPAKNGTLGSLQAAGDTDSANDRGQGGGEGDGTDQNRGRMNPPAMRGGGGEEVDKPVSPQGIQTKPQTPTTRPRPQVQQRDAPRPEQQQPRPETPKTPRPPIPWLRILMIILVASALLWFIIRNRKAIAEAISAFARSVRAFFVSFCNWIRNLFQFRWRRKAAPVEEIPDASPILEPFASYTNPFVTRKEQAWPPEKLVRYTYETLQAWAKEQGIEIEPQQTPREFCARLIERFPECGPDLERLSFFYSYVAFAERLPDDFEIEPLRRLWQYMGDSVASLHAN